MQKALHTHTHTWMYVCTNVRVCVCSRTDVCACVWESVCVRTYPCMPTSVTKTSKPFEFVLTLIDTKPLLTFVNCEFMGLKKGYCCSGCGELLILLGNSEACIWLLFLLTPFNSCQLLSVGSSKRIKNGRKKKQG